VSFAEEDRIFSEDIVKIKNIISDFSFVDKVNEFANEKGVNLNEGFNEFALEIF
jgi:histidine ammonia-lyase